MAEQIASTVQKHGNQKQHHRETCKNIARIGEPNESQMDDFVLHSSATESDESSEGSDSKTVSSELSSDVPSAGESQDVFPVEAGIRRSSSGSSVLGSASVIHSANMILDSAKKSLSLARRSSLVRSV